MNLIDSTVPFQLFKNWLPSNIQNILTIEIKLKFKEHFTGKDIKSSIMVCENFKTGIFHKYTLHG